MVEVQDEVAELEDEIAFLFDKQVIQDERIFTLEQETSGVKHLFHISGPKSAFPDVGRGKKLVKVYFFPREVKSKLCTFLSQTRSQIS